MKSSKPFLKTGVIGLLVIAMSIGLLAVFPSTAPNMPDGFFTPIIAFEFIQTRTEVFGLFTPADGAESVNEAMIAAFDLGNRLDYIYMGLYSAFLMMFSMTCARLSGKKYFYAAAALSLAVLAGDAFENIQLLGITSYLKSGLNSGDLETQLDLLYRFTWIKWGGLAAIFLVLAPWFLRGGRFSKTVGLSGIVCAGLGLAVFFYRSIISEIFGLSVGVMFLLMIIYCFRYNGSAPYLKPHTSR